MNEQRLQRSFFKRDVLEVAPDLLGRMLVRYGSFAERFIITEVEAYRGEEDLACHARFGRTARTEIMYGRAGNLYVYLIYGLYWMLNIVTGDVDEPQALLIRGVQGISGPGRVGRCLSLDKSFYGEDLTSSQRIWLEEFDVWSTKFEVKQTTRVGVDYAGEWAKKPWRWILLSGKSYAKND